MAGKKSSSGSTPSSTKASKKSASSTTMNNEQRQNNKNQQDYFETEKKELDLVVDGGMTNVHSRLMDVKLNPSMKEPLKTKSAKSAKSAKSSPVTSGATSSNSDSVTGTSTGITFTPQPAPAFSNTKSTKSAKKGSGGYDQGFTEDSTSSNGSNAEEPTYSNTKSAKSSKKSAQSGYDTDYQQEEQQPLEKFSPTYSSGKKSTKSTKSTKSSSSGYDSEKYTTTSTTAATTTIRVVTPKPTRKPTRKPTATPKPTRSPVATTTAATTTQDDFFNEDEVSTTGTMVATTTVEQDLIEQDKLTTTTTPAAVVTTPTTTTTTTTTSTTTTTTTTSSTTKPQTTTTKTQSLDENELPTTTTTTTHQRPATTTTTTTQPLNENESSTSTTTTATTTTTRELPASPLKTINLGGVKMTQCGLPHALVNDNGDALAFVNQRYDWNFNACWDKNGDGNANLNDQLMQRLGTSLVQQYLNSQTCPRGQGAGNGPAILSSSSSPQPTGIQYPTVPPACERIRPESISVEVGDSTAGVECYACQHWFHVFWLMQEQDSNHRQLLEADNMYSPNGENSNEAEEQSRALSATVPTTANTDPTLQMYLDADAEHNQQVGGFLDNWFHEFPSTSHGALASSVVFLEWVEFVNTEEQSIAATEAAATTTSTTTTEATTTPQPRTSIVSGLEGPETVSSSDNGGGNGIILGASMGALLLLLVGALFVWKRRGQPSGGKNDDMTRGGETLSLGYDTDDDILEERHGVDVRGLNPSYSYSASHHHQASHRLVRVPASIGIQDDNNWMCGTECGNEDTMCSNGEEDRAAALDKALAQQQRRRLERQMKLDDDEEATTAFSFFMSPIVTTLFFPEHQREQSRIEGADRRN